MAAAMALAVLMASEFSSAVSVMRMPRWAPIASARRIASTALGGPIEIVAKSALNRGQHMGFKWSLNPYQGCYHSCVYCFARAHAKLADRDPGAGFSARVGVKVNVPELLRGELSGRSWKRETVAFGT